MIEQSIPLENIDPVIFFGAKNSNLELIKSYFPELIIVARDDMLKVKGKKEQVLNFTNAFQLLSGHYNYFNTIDSKSISLILSGEMDALDTASEHKEDILLFGNSGKPIRAKTKNQKKLAELTQKKEMLFAIGPAGSGKTYTAIALAVKALKNKSAKKIILSRPAVEAGENLGFLPGDLKEKFDPYFQPLYDALSDMIPHKKLTEFLKDGTIQIAPLAFMRGRTLSDAYVILDEAQNATILQLKMFLTRMGMNTKYIITGDITQIDLPKKRNSGLPLAIKILSEIDGISVIEFDKNDIVRHQLVKDIVKAYDNYNDRNKN